MAGIEYPAVLFSSEEVRSPFVLPMTNDDELHTHAYRRYYRKGGFQEFLVVDRKGRRVKGAVLGVEKLDYGYAFRFGIGIGLMAAVFETLTLDPPVRLRFRLEEDGTEPIDATKQRIYRYLRLNPRHYSWAGVKALRGRVAKAPDMADLVRRFSAD